MRLDTGEVMELDADVAVRFQISRGLNLTEEKKIEVLGADECIRARKKLVQYVALRRKTTQEAQRYLKRSGFSQQAINEAVSVAMRLGYIDDLEYAKAFVRTRQRNGTKGPRMVMAELQARGIPRDDAQKVVEEMEDSNNQMETARKLAAKKYLLLKDVADQNKASKRLMAHLVRRGFDPEISAVVTREFFGDPTVF